MIFIRGGGETTCPPPPLDPLMNKHEFVYSHLFFICSDNFAIQQTATCCCGSTQALSKVCFPVFTNVCIWSVVYLQLTPSPSNRLTYSSFSRFTDIPSPAEIYKARIFLLVDLRGKKSDMGGGTKKNKKNSENDQ